jgi:hypothetical protein
MKPIDLSTQKGRNEYAKSISKKSLINIMKFKIVKRGKWFEAFDLVDKKRSYGKIHMDTGKFVGDTRCLLELSQFQETYKQEIVDEVLENIKKDVADGDLTAIEELLKFLPIENLKNYLPEVW